MNIFSDFLPLILYYLQVTGISSVSQTEDKSKLQVPTVMHLEGETHMRKNYSESCHYANRLFLMQKLPAALCEALGQTNKQAKLKCSLLKRNACP